MIWSIIEAFNVNLVGFQFEGVPQEPGHAEAIERKHILAFGAWMPAAPWKNAGKFTIDGCRIRAIPAIPELMDNLDLPEKFGSKGQLYYHILPHNTT